MTRRRQSNKAAPPTRVLFLGAGASFSAGYPLGARLIREIERHFESTNRDRTAGNEWARFLDYRRNAKDVAKTLLTSGNPEVVLSYIDLCVEALSSLEHAIEQKQQDAVDVLKTLTSGAKQMLFARETGEELQSLYDDLLRNPLKAAEKARRGFLIGFDTYLEWRHMMDAEPDAVSHRSYIHRELEFVRDGDVVITTNYDTLAERTLMEQGRWSPADGYGFTVPLRVGAPDTPDLADALPSWAIGPSRVRVLKLHGSYGWRSLEIGYTVGSGATGKDGIFLDSGLFYCMRPAAPDQFVPVYDRREQRAGFPVIQPVLAYPSFLKRMEGASLAQVWEQARIALAQASEIRVLGASLPPADAAVRALLSPLRFRLLRGEVALCVHDMSRHTVERWREHLGEKVAWERRNAG